MSKVPIKFELNWIISHTTYDCRLRSLRFIYEIYGIHQSQVVDLLNNLLSLRPTWVCGCDGSASAISSSLAPSRCRLFLLTVTYFNIDMPPDPLFHQIYSNCVIQTTSWESAFDRWNCSARVADHASSLHAFLLVDSNSYIRVTLHFWLKVRMNQSN